MKYALGSPQPQRLARTRGRWKLAAGFCVEVGCGSNVNFRYHPMPLSKLWILKVHKKQTQGVSPYKKLSLIRQGSATGIHLHLQRSCMICYWPSPPISRMASVSKTIALLTPCMRWLAHLATIMNGICVGVVSLCSSVPCCSWIVWSCKIIEMLIAQWCVCVWHRARVWVWEVS